MNLGMLMMCLLGGMKKKRVNENAIVNGVYTHPHGWLHFHVQRLFFLLFRYFSNFLLFCYFSNFSSSFSSSSSVAKVILRILPLYAPTCTSVGL